MDRFARVVLGYHGCLEPLASDLLAGRASLDEWRESDNSYDWLGRGIYFWEHARGRASRWANERAAAHGGTPAVIGAVIQLGRCFDLTDEAFTRVLGAAYADLRQLYRAARKAMPINRGARDEHRERDCLVINHALASSEVAFQTVRSPFWEGEPAFTGARIRSESHIQIAVRDRSCILGVFRPTL